MENAAEPLTDRSATATGSATGRKSFNRAAVTNGRRLFAAGVDGRSAEARRLRDLVERFAEPWGTLSAAPEPVQQLVRRAAALSVQAEAIEARMAAGEAVDPVQHATVSNALSRLLGKLDRARPAPRKPTRVDPYAADKSRSIADIFAAEEAAE